MLHQLHLVDVAGAVREDALGAHAHDDLRALERAEANVKKMDALIKKADASIRDAEQSLDLKRTQLENIRRAGRAKYSPLILKRGMFFSGGAGVNQELWQWMQGVVAGVRPIARYDGIVQVMDVREVVVANWVFDRGLPAKIRGPELNAKTGEVAIEELHIAHEGLRLVTP